MHLSGIKMKHKCILVLVYKVVTIHFMNTLSGLKYFIPLTNYERAHWNWSYYIYISFSLVNGRLRDWDFVHRHNYISADYTKLIVLVFNIEIGRLRYFKN